MKKIEVVITGEHEAEIGHEILSGVYAAIKNHKCTDFSIKADTLEERGRGEIQIPDFLKPRKKGALVEARGGV